MITTTPTVCETDAATPLYRQRHFVVAIALILVLAAAVAHAGIMEGSWLKIDYTTSGETTIGTYVDTASISKASDGKRIATVRADIYTPKNGGTRMRLTMVDVFNCKASTYTVRQTTGEVVPDSIHEYMKQVTQGNGEIVTGAKPTDALVIALVCGL